MMSIMFYDPIEVNTTKELIILYTCYGINHLVAMITFLSSLRHLPVRTLWFRIWPSMNAVFFTLLFVVSYPHWSYKSKVLTLNKLSNFVIIVLFLCSGLTFKLGTKVTGARKEGSGIKVSVENVKDSSKKEEVRTE